MANMASTTLIEEPLVIGAGDLLRGVKYTHCGVLYVQNDSHFGKKWKQRYVIISEGCLYIYPDRKSKKSEHAYSFKQFDSAIDCDPINGETVCFCLRYKNGHGSILFSCDTRETREKWLNTFWAVISEVETTFNKLSLDSGYGSAETVPRNTVDMPTYEDGPGYDEVNDRKFEETNNFPVQACADDDAYEIPIASGRSYSTRTDSLYENVNYQHKDDMRHGTTKNAQRNVKSDALMNELKASKALSKRTAHLSAKERSEAHAETTHSPRSLLARSLPSSVSLSFMSVRGNIDPADEEQSISYLSVHGQDSVYANERNLDDSVYSDDTCLKSRYTDAQEQESLKQCKFASIDYICDRKDEVKRALHQKTTGEFAVCRGESTQHELCVMTPHGVKYFRIYHQNGKLSLFKSHKKDTFESLDELLSYYNANDLPAADYSVKLQKGYKSIS
ncbi:uncharacterized protein LOC123524172 [Mercenaria mercenaria]|uniref:uncharacterized protein LOC123524172 n=1 Tax=Mercenaria mercenaria TaxID=6596 RepID=UPI00234F8F5C|nr:uncharacterized protein LOC123524172 [Mercenaria mercenaria]XP_053395115.1 uncharacterized protein LOC123524172 [Mercenaria mercenaria]